MRNQIANYQTAQQRLRLGSEMMASTADDFEQIVRRPVVRYEAQQLHDRNDRCWGVVGLPDGALACNDNGKLLIRLSKGEAHAMAALMTVDLAAFGRAVCALLEPIQ